MQPAYAASPAAPPVTSLAFWHNPEREIASSDSDTATAQTIRKMCAQIKKGANDQRVQDVARKTVNQFSGLGGTEDAERIAVAAWWWPKLFVKFVHHEFIIRQRLGETGHLQGLISPEVLVAMNRPEGDCAIFSMLICAFLRVWGIPYELVTVAVNPNEPDVFSHVFVYAVLPHGQRLPLDASHGKYAGWQVPSSDIFRRQVWNSDGEPVSDQGSRFDGLHNYGMRGMGQSGCADPTDPNYNSGLPCSYDLASFGVTSAAGGCITPGDPNYGTTLPCAGTSSTLPGSTTAATPTASSLQSEINSLLNAWTKIGGQVVAPTVTYTSPYGSYTAPAGSAAAIANPLTAATANIAPLLLIGGGILLLVLVMGKR